MLIVKPGGTHTDHSALKGQVPYTAIFQHSFVITTTRPKIRATICSTHCTTHIKATTHLHSIDVTLTSQQVFCRITPRLLIYTYHFLSLSELIPSYCPKYTGTSPVFIVHISPSIRSPKHTQIRRAALTTTFDAEAFIDVTSNTNKEVTTITTITTTTNAATSDANTTTTNNNNNNNNNNKGD